MKTDSELPRDLIALNVDADLARGESVYRALRIAIEAGKLEPGSRMREKALAVELGVSRTPVREALHRLLADGLVTQLPSRGLVVTDLDRQQILELFALREVLEGTAASFAAHRGSESHIEMLHGIVDRERPLLEAGDGPALAALNMEFHRTLWEAAHNRYLEAAVRSTADSLSLQRGADTLNVPERQQSSHAEHRQIVAAIEQHDAEMAERTARQHIREARRIRMRLLFPRN